MCEQCRRYRDEHAGEPCPTGAQLLRDAEGEAELERGWMYPGVLARRAWLRHVYGTDADADRWGARV